MSSGEGAAVQVLVVGAGPVGLFAGLCAARRGLRVEVVDELPQASRRGYATILHPRSLRLLGELGLAARLQEQGRRVDRIAIYVDGARAAVLTLPGPALAVPQRALMQVLGDALRDEGVEVKQCCQATSVTELNDRVEVRMLRGEPTRLGSPPDYGAPELETSVIQAKFLIGADGYDSRVRSALGIGSLDVGSSETFAIFEFASEVDFGAEVQLAFDESLGGTMVPLVGGRVRWAFQVVSELSEKPDYSRLRALLQRRAPWYAAGAGPVDWGTVTHFERRLARRFGQGRVWLAGDAAHVTSPFGGQSMNVGLDEASDLVTRIASNLEGKAGLETLEQYGLDRQREWHKLLGFNVCFELLPHAHRWLGAHARAIVPALPASGADLQAVLEQLGLVVR